ncbi:MarR family winged helix-turn-helix transcriptional regulator [Streptomyces sp. RS10V-4]|uniref:MarR family winged helix-turn-helix transcriptional regulator n=1 Tax=Streptomyces rhizoryzae TaxID=2932493 RepID=UPI0020054433|nr:MarR family winged helix-turn-helix transcriptional regulator [Streptomyces rhizoryzae]MCK7622248.1 MarR family winged helix-turn-helix transcriptional regulator [Streptomyces rhizoryzae]
MPDTTPPSLTSLTTYLLSKVGKRARGLLAERLAAQGLRLWHLATLAALADFGPHAQRDLAGRLAIHASDMAKLLDELAGRDLLTRDRDPGDRRRVLVAITPAGRALLSDLTDQAASVQDTVLDPLTAEERTVLHGLLLRLYGGR